MKALLQIRGLKTCFFKDQNILRAVDEVDLRIDAGETLALVGESGCGKTTTAFSIFRLIPSPGKIVGGTIEFRGQNIFALSEKEMSALRGREMGFIFQDPAAALNPVMRVGEQITEVIRQHFRETRRTAKQQALALMEKVQLPNAEMLYNHFPHQLSGGLRQRVLIAIALAGKPSLLVADEPTSALDVSIQSQILALLKQLKNDLQLSLLLITHDLGVVAHMADPVAVMYTGKIVEEAATPDLFTSPSSPLHRGVVERRAANRILSQRQATGTQAARRRGS
jgi:ABC-type dipeptide/oligopeptide/nickel transport system ATPase component